MAEVAQAMNINHDLISTSFMQPSEPLLPHSRPAIVEPVGHGTPALSVDADEGKSGRELARRPRGSVGHARLT